jgi:hypothetical protein
MPATGYSQVPQGSQQQVLLQKGNQALENAGKKFGGLWKLLFFVCACCVITAGTLSIFSGVINMISPFDFINYIYLTLFGLLMLVIDFPIEHPVIKNIKMSIFHYALFMCRFVGRGIWYLFLSAMTVGALWDNEVSPFLGFFLGGYVFFVALYSLFYGIQLSQRLERVRQKVLEQGPEHWASYIPPYGMNKAQFSELADTLLNKKSGDRPTFSEEELNYIVNAFSFEVRSDEIISKEEFDEWARGTTGMFLL